MNKAALFFQLWLTATLAAANWNVPLVGMARDTKNRLHPVYGVAGSFVLRGPLSGNVLNWAFDASGGLVQTEGEIRVLDTRGNVIERRAAPAMEVILGPRYAFFPKTGELWPAGASAGGSTAIEATAIAGRVIALGPADQRGIVVAACRGNQLWLLAFGIKDGALKHESAPGGPASEQACADPGALLKLGDRLLLAAAHEIVIQMAAGHERRVPIPPNHGARIHRAGEDTVQIEVPGLPSHLMRITGEGERLYEMPTAEGRP
jgi:hypothetical protein